MRRFGAALAAAGALTVVAAGPAGATVIEGETLNGVGVHVVREHGAVGGRALAIAPGGRATRDLRTGSVGVVDARVRGACWLRVQLDGGHPRAVVLRRRWRDRRVHLSVPAGRHLLRLSVPARRRCGATVDLLRLRAAAPAPAPAPADRPAPAPAPAPAPNGHVPLGTAVQLGYLQKDAGYAAAVGSGIFSTFSPENELKMEWVQPDEGRWNFAPADALVDWAVAHRMSVRGHTLIFGKQTPSWVGRLLFPKDVDQALQTEVRTVMGRYKANIHEWDVVNEAFDDYGHWRSNAFYNALGPAYVDHAFIAARQTDPTAKLYYNEYNADVANAKQAAVVKLVAHLASQHLIDGVGLQLHTAIGHAPTHDALLATMKQYASMGLDVEITEMDVDARGDGQAASLPDRLAQQAEVYRAAASACAESPNCKRFTVWGVGDKYSWLGADRVPLLLDANFQPKPALGVVRQTLGS